MGYKGKSNKAESGCVHNPEPRTERGKRRRAKKDAAKKAAGGTSPAAPAAA